jgi:hypothetical protein
MSIQKHIFGYCRHTSPMLRAGKMNPVKGINSLLQNGMMHFVREDEP